ncbi:MULTISPECIES: hypothetical protein [Nostocaceae]|uniref:hypothetical protein n=1 Tax=Nostocaceae TaxID=1162 RepID=UPI00168BD6AC|nr:MULTISPECIES: hypothetical protein [Nostocaceae]
MKEKFRIVNRILGDRPRLGPFPADQIFPWSAIAILNVLVLNYIFQVSWLATGLSIAWGWATWWVLSSNRTFFGKFVGVPRISRGYMTYKALKNQDEN